MPTKSLIAVTTIHTEVGQILRTLAYMSPEQCAADPSRIDTATDIYSLGVILFELLTGRMPYDVAIYKAFLQQRRALIAKRLNEFLGAHS